VDSLAELCLPRPLEASKRQKLIDCINDLPPVSQWTSQHDAVNGRLRDLLVLLTSTPDYQFQ
jgi:hypothetical protein